MVLNKEEQHSLSRGFCGVSSLSRSLKGQLSTTMTLPEYYDSVVLLHCFSCLLQPVWPSSFLSLVVCDLFTRPSVFLFGEPLVAVVILPLYWLFLAAETYSPSLLFLVLLPAVFHCDSLPFAICLPSSPPREITKIPNPPLPSPPRVCAY